MSNALQTLDFGSVQTRKTDVTKYASSAKFLRRIQLYGKEQVGPEGQVLIRAGRYGIPMSKTEITDLGEQIDVIPFAVRDKVLDTNPEVPVAVYNPEREEFKTIMADAVDEDGKVMKDSGIMFGPSFLVLERTTGQLYELVLGNASGREESKRIEPFLPIDNITAEELGCDPQGPTQCTLTRKYVRRGRFEWWAPVVVKCSVEFETFPPQEEVLKQIQEFVTVEIEGEDDEEADDNERTR